MLPARRSPHDREIVRLALPAFGALAAEPLYILVDTAIVGHLGTNPLAGLAVAGTVLTATFAIFNFLAYSTTGAVARQIGAGNRARVGTQARASRSRVTPPASPCSRAKSHSSSPRGTEPAARRSRSTSGTGTSVRIRTTWRARSM